MLNVKNYPILIILLLFFGFAVRMIYIFKFAPKDISIPSGDALGYHILAKNLIKHSQFAFEVGKPTGRREPLYPIFLAIIYRFLGESLVIVRSVQVVVNIISIFFIYLIAKEIFDETTAFVSVVISSVWPNFIYFCGALLREIFFMFFVLLVVFMLIRCTKTDNIVDYIIFGILSALMSLIKSEGIVMFGLYWIYLVYRKLSFKKIFIVLTSFLLIYSVWIYRNYKVFKTFIVGNTWGGLAFWAGTDILPFEIRGLPEEEVYKLSLKDVIEAQKLNEIEENIFYYKRAINYYLNNPTKIITLAIKKFLKFWKFLPYKGRVYGVNDKIMRLIGSISIPVFILFFVGVVLLIFSSNLFSTKRIIVLIPIISMCFIYCIFFAQIRYRIPIEPFIIIIASFTTKNLLDLAKEYYYGTR